VLTGSAVIAPNSLD